jgi:hypothetical protein
MGCEFFLIVGSFLTSVIGRSVFVVSVVEALLSSIDRFGVNVGL